MSEHRDVVGHVVTGATAPWRRYLSVFTGFLTVLLLAIAAFNYMVDPIGIWRFVVIDGFNVTKSERRDQVYIFKARDMQRLKPRILLLGSSRAAFGLNPSHPMFEPGTAYNLSIPGGHLPVIEAYLEHALSNNDQVEMVLLGLDLFSFNKNLNEPISFEPRRLGRKSIWPDDALASLLTVDALENSIMTVVSNVVDPGNEPYSVSGQLTAIEMRRRVERIGMPARFEQSTALYLNGSNRYAGFVLDDGVYEDVRRIVALCDAHGVDLHVFVSPVHVVLREAIRLRGHEETYRDWLARLTEITPFWDFSGYNDITSEDVQFSMENYWDISHFRSGIGDLIISTLLGEPAARRGFGRYVTADTVEEHIAMLAEEQASYLRDNPETEAWLLARRRELAVNTRPD